MKRRMWRVRELKRSWLLLAAALLFAAGIGLGWGKLSWWWRLAKPIDEVPVELEERRLRIEADPALAQSDAGADAVPYPTLSVYWVGHSLMSARDQLTAGAKNVVELVGEMARARGLGYRAFDHTLAGSPLSMNWRGKSEKTGQRDGRALALRRELLERGDAYDVLIFTEAINLARVMKKERSGYYGRQFYCAATRARTSGRVFMYPTWHHYYASDPQMKYPPRAEWDWRRRLDEDRPRWRALAQQVQEGTGEDDDCETGTTVQTLPIDDAVAALSDALQQRPEDFGGMRMADFFVNPLAEGASPLADPLGPAADSQHGLDDIHASATGDYFVALVVFSVLYEQSPLGLPALNGVSQQRARALQQLVAQVLEATAD